MDESMDDAATTAALAREFHAEGFVALLPRHLRPPDALVTRVRDAVLRKFDAHVRLASKRALDLRLPKNAEVLDGFYVRQGGRVDMRLVAENFQASPAMRVRGKTKQAEEEEEGDEEELKVDEGLFREMAQYWQRLVDELFRDATGAESGATASLPTHRLEYIGCVVARPGDADQNWHLDGVHRNLVQHEKGE